MDNYTRFIDPTRIYLLRDLLKLEKNIDLWIKIKEILGNNKYNLSVKKIQAHGKDELHNKVDREIKDWYKNIDLLYNTGLKKTIDIYKYPLKWNNIMIETNIRSYNTYRRIGKFLNLNRKKITG